MALIKCPECGKEISDKAVVCTQCGFPVKQMNKMKNEKGSNTIKIPQKTLKTLIIISIIVFVVFLLLSMSSVWYLSVVSYFGYSKLGIGIIVAPIVKYYGSTPVRILGVVSIIVTLISLVSTIMFGILMFKQRKQ